jgi:hypothetical protein
MFFTKHHGHLSRETSGSNKFIVGFEVLTAVSMKMAVFWVVAPCSLVEVYQRFRGACCLHRQGDEGLIALNSSLVSTTAVVSKAIVATV